MHTVYKIWNKEWKVSIAEQMPRYAVVPPSEAQMPTNGQFLRYWIIQLQTHTERLVSKAEQVFYHLFFSYFKAPQGPSVNCRGGVRQLSICTWQLRGFSHTQTRPCIYYTNHTRAVKPSECIYVCLAEEIVSTGLYKIHYCCGWLQGHCYEGIYFVAQAPKTLKYSGLSIWLKSLL